MISILSSFKPFRGHVAQLQENSLKNWRRLGRGVEIVIYGDAPGVAENAQNASAVHVPEIGCSERGIPCFDAIVSHAKSHARFDMQVYLNGDILLPPNFVEEIQRVPFSKFLMVGQRIDLAQGARFDLHTTDWHSEIETCRRSAHAELHGPTGIDYFVFPRGLWDGLPRLVIGRGGYDNALLAFCLRHHIPIIDLTRRIHVIHQWHDYSHVNGAFSEAHHGKDAMSNLQLHDIMHSKPTLLDCDWLMGAHGVVEHRGSDWLRRMEVLVRYRLGLRRISYPLRAIARFAQMFGTLRPRPLVLSEVLNETIPLL